MVSQLEERASRGPPLFPHRLLRRLSHPSPEIERGRSPLPHRLPAPLDQFDETSLEDEPEINFRHHCRLVDGILAQAYNKDDSETLDPDKAARHLKFWLGHINEMSKGRIRLHQTQEFLGPNYGAI